MQDPTVESSSEEVSQEEPPPPRTDSLTRSKLEVRSFVDEDDTDNEVDESDDDEDQRRINATGIYQRNSNSQG